MPSSPAACYFSYVPSSHPDPSAHYSVETPSPGPHHDILSPDTPSERSNPLLAARLPPQALASPAMDASKVLQLQTAAAYSYQARQQPQPLQDVLDLSPMAGSGSSSSSSTTSAAGSPSMQFIRCSRCHRSANPGSKVMVRFGINSYYCTRCADIVGYHSHG